MAMNEETRALTQTVLDLSKKMEKRLDSIQADMAEMHEDIRSLLVRAEVNKDAIAASKVITDEYVAKTALEEKNDLKN
jgi:hypothetical protein